MKGVPSVPRGGRLTQPFPGAEVHGVAAARRRDLHVALVHEHAVLRGLDQDFEGGALDAQAEQRRIDPDIPGLARLDLDQNAPALVTQASVLSRLGDGHDQPALGRDRQLIAARDQRDLAIRPGLDLTTGRQNFAHCEALPAGRAFRAPRGDAGGVEHDPVGGGRHVGAVQDEIAYAWR